MSSFLLKKKQNDIEDVIEDPISLIILIMDY